MLISFCNKQALLFLIHSHQPLIHSHQPLIPSRQRAVLQPVGIGLVGPTAVDDLGDLERLSHGPVDVPVFFKVDIALAVKVAFLSMGPDVFRQPYEQLLIHTIPEEVLMRPGFG